MKYEKIVKYSGTKVRRFAGVKRSTFEKEEQKQLNMIQWENAVKISAKEYTKSGFSNENNVSNVESAVTTLRLFFLSQHV